VVVQRPRRRRRATHVESADDDGASKDQFVRSSGGRSSRARALDAACALEQSHLLVIVRDTVVAFPWAFRGRPAAAAAWLMQQAGRSPSRPQSEPAATACVRCPQEVHPDPCDGVVHCCVVLRLYGIPYTEWPVHAPVRSRAVHAAGGGQ
jgi:hypothetical protein